MTGLAELAGVLPSGSIILDPEVIDSHSRDRAEHCSAGRASALIRPRTTEEVQAVMRWASRHRVPVVPQGARSGLSGAANAVDGCVLLSLERMNGVLEIDTVNQVVVTQPGVLNADLSRAVMARGLFYPPDPSSWEFCTIGGNLATNSGGLCCVKYGVTSDYVLALEVVLASGEVLRTGTRTRKGVAGYDLTRLLVGSEGTLGVITEATLRLRTPGHEPRTIAATFPTAAAALAAVSAVIRSGHAPSMLEFMDATVLAALNDAFGMGFDLEAGALLIAQSDLPADQAVAEIAALEDLFAAGGSLDVIVADDPQEGEALLEARRQALPAMERRGVTLLDDVCVPGDRLVTMISAIQEVAAARELVIGSVAHAGDGNLHPIVVYDPTSDAERSRAEHAYDDIMGIALRLGGTITGEHGVGIMKKRRLEEELGDVSLTVHRLIKQAIDPHGVLNPGKVFDSPRAKTLTVEAD